MPTAAASDANEGAHWIDRHGAISCADVVRIARMDMLKASKLLAAWRERGLSAPLPERAKRNMAYTKPSGAEATLSLLSEPEDNNRGGR